MWIQFSSATNNCRTKGIPKSGYLFKWHVSLVVLTCFEKYHTCFEIELSWIKWSETGSPPLNMWSCCNSYCPKTKQNNKTKQQKLTSVYAFSRLCPINLLSFTTKLVKNLCIFTVSASLFLSLVLPPITMLCHTSSYKPYFSEILFLVRSNG